jgi:xanthine dehydrogenase YagT iron-sulfur-binding subunit
MNRIETPIAVGIPGPSFVLHGDAGPPLSSSEARGRPWVLAFVRRWSPGEDASAGAIRAQLRGLGAILFIVSDAGVWSFRPDDDVELVARPSVRLRREIAELGARYGVPAGEDGVFVLDEAGRVRFAQAPSLELTSALAEALAAAGRELLGLPPRPGITRRDLAIKSLVAGFGLVLLANCHPRSAERPAAAATPGAPTSTDIDIVLRINRQDRRLRIDARASLLDVLREQLALTGTRKGCDHGQCGACTVLRDGRAVNACLTLAAAAEGAEITTIEGLAKGDQLHPLQAAFISHDAFQCGYCTSGQIMAGVAVIREGRARSDAEVRQQMSGNICRCGAYPNIIAAIQAARKEV